MSRIERNNTKTSNSGRKIIFLAKRQKGTFFFGSPFINSYLAKLGDFHVKCNWCKTDISVSNLGFTAVKGHSETKGHVQIADLRMKRLTDRAVVSNREN